MRDIRVDPEARTLLAQPGVRLGDVDHETQAFGLAAVSGINSETGLAGLALGGGIGWQMRKHGLTIDQLVSADLITPHARTLDQIDPFLTLEGVRLIWERNRG